MKDKIINSLKDGTFVEKTKARIHGIIQRLYVKMFNKTPLDDNKIMFLTFQGRYTCNPKAVCDELIKRNEGYKLIWVVKKEDLKDKDKFPKEITLVRRGTLKFYKEIASSKVLVENANDSLYLHYKKKKGQIYIQSWHGSMGFKRIDTVNNEKWMKLAKMVGKETDYLISNSEFETEVYRTSFWKDNKILEYGHPRNDVLLNIDKKEAINKQVREYYNIDEDTKIILYAPTFRDNFTMETYNIDIKKVLDAFEKRFKCKCVFMLRMHYKLRNVNIPKNIEKQVINATDYYDMQDLLCTCDFGITDYSSWMCDYILTDNPGFLYINDYEKYVDERGFYYPLTETPFPLAKTNDDLVKNILEFDEKKYKKDKEKFLQKRGCKENGNATDKVIDLIHKHTK